MGKDSIYFPLEVRPQWGLLREHNVIYTVLLKVLAGCGAGASQVVFTNPLEIVKIRLQVQVRSL
jgi:solute carrier family 25 aspartate/glutamate transporter 12/13